MKPIIYFSLPFLFCFGRKELLLAGDHSSIRNDVIVSGDDYRQLRGENILTLGIEEENVRLHHSNGTSSGESNGIMSNSATLAMIILGAATVILGIIYYCSCRENTSGYYDGRPGDRKKSAKHFDTLEEEIPRTPEDDVTDDNTRNNAASRFITPEQYINLFKGNYQHIKSRRTSAHANRLGLNMKIPLVNTTRDLTPAEAQIASYFVNDDENISLQPALLYSSERPKVWVRWADQVDSVSEDGGNYGKDAESKQEELQSELEDDVVSLTNNKAVVVITGGEYARDSSSSAGAISESDDKDIKILGYNPQTAVGKSAEYVPVKMETVQSEASTNSVNLERSEIGYDDNKKRFQNIFKKASFSTSDKSTGRRRESSKVPTEEPKEESTARVDTSPDMISASKSEELLASGNFVSRGSGQCLPIPTRLSPPPAEKGRKVAHPRKKDSFTWAISDSDRPPTLKSPLVRQNSLEPDELGLMLQKVQKKAKTLVSQCDSHQGSPNKDRPVLRAAFSISESEQSRDSGSPCSPLTLSALSPEEELTVSHLPPPLPLPQPKLIPEEKKVNINNYLAESHSSASNVDIQKFVKMLRVGIPPDAVKHKMETSGVDPSLLDCHIEDTEELSTLQLASKPPPPLAISSPLPPFPSSGYNMNKTLPTTSPISAGSKTNIDNFLVSSHAPSDDMEKFVKMLKVGIPPEAVKFKMEKSGMDPSLLDSHIEDSLQ